jgi:hypothetical protein
MLLAGIQVFESPGPPPETCGGPGSFGLHSKAEGMTTKLQCWMLTILVKVEKLNFIEPCEADKPLPQKRSFQSLTGIIASRPMTLNVELDVLNLKPGT